MSGPIEVRRRAGAAWAMRWDGSGVDDLAAFTGKDVDYFPDSGVGTYALIGGWQIVTPGRWVLVDEQGRVRVIADRTYVEDYEALKDGEPVPWPDSISEDGPR